LWPVAVFALSAGVWDFEHGCSDWQSPGPDSGVVVDPDGPTNHAFQIVATKPQHTRLILADSQEAPDFIASLRFKVMSFEGETPVVYIYGRTGSNGFRGLTIRDGNVVGICYVPRRVGDATHLGSVRLPRFGDTNGWIHASIACYQDLFFGRAWSEGRAEPAWQITGNVPGPERGKFGVGVWTSPTTPSKARVLFDDMSFHPLAPQDIASLKKATSPRPALDLQTVPAVQGPFETTALAGIVKADTVLAFDRKTGTVAHLVQRSSRQEFLCTTESRPLFTLELAKDSSASKQETSAADFRTVIVKRNGLTGWTLEFTNHLTLPLSVRVEVGLADDDLIHCRFALSNYSDWAATSIRFPDMVWAPQLGKTVDDDELLLPWNDGAIQPKPAITARNTFPAEFPGRAFTQFTAYYDKSAGVFFGAHDSAGQCKQWDLKTGGGRYVHMALSHLRPQIPNRSEALPYDIVLGTFRGDWRDAADIYKRWAKRQPWCARTLQQRDDIPRFFKEGAGVLVNVIQSASGYNGVFGEHLNKLPQVLRDYRQRTELAHIIFIPYGWENRGAWAGINYFPAVPSDEAWVKMNATLRAQGDRIAFLTSGYWWVVKRKATASWRAFDDTADFEKRKDMVIWRADGQPYAFDNYDQTANGGNWRGLSYKLCHGSPAANETIKEIFLNAARLGVPLISFDQEIGGGQQQPCYRVSHGHPPGYGNWMWTGFRDTCARILSEGKPIQPELGLFMENVSELAIPYMATYWSRQFSEFDYGGYGARGIALFSYLYHEYVTAIGAACVQGQGAHGTRPSAEMRCYILANNLVRGLIPGPFMTEVPLESDDPWKATVAKAYFSFCKPYARFPEYLALGITRHPPVVQCAEQEVWLWRDDSKGQPQRPGGPRISKAFVKLAAVAAGSFEAADGSVGTVIVNTTAVPQNAVVELRAKGSAATLYKPDRTQVQRWKQSPLKISVSLEPFGTRMLIVK